MFVLFRQLEYLFGEALPDAGSNLDAGALPTEEEAGADGKQATDELAPQDGPLVHPVLATQNGLNLWNSRAHQVGKVGLD